MTKKAKQRSSSVSLQGGKRTEAKKQTTKKGKTEINNDTRRVWRTEGVKEAS